MSRLWLSTKDSCLCDNIHFTMKSVVKEQQVRSRNKIGCSIGSQADPGGEGKH